MIETLYVICGLRRAGTGLMIDHLKAAGAGKPEEWLNYDGHLMGIDDLIQRMRIPQPGPVVGIKVFWHHIDVRNVPDAGRFLDRFIKQCNAKTVKYIFMDRRDKVRQAASWKRVMAGGGWQSRHSAPVNEIEYDRADLEQRISYLQDQVVRWGSYFEEREIEPLRVYYEDFVHDIPDTVTRVCHYIGAGTFNPNADVRQKQSGEEVERIVKRFQDETQC